MAHTALPITEVLVVADAWQNEPDAEAVAAPLEELAREGAVGGLRRRREGRDAGRGERRATVLRRDEAREVGDRHPQVGVERAVVDVEPAIAQERPAGVERVGKHRRAQDIVRPVVGPHQSHRGVLRTVQQDVAKFVRENEAHIEAVQVLLGRPRDWSASALKELWQKLAGSRYGFTADKLQKAHEVRYKKPLVDVISMVKHAAVDSAPLLTAEERVRAAVGKVTNGRAVTDEQRQWLGYIEQHLVQNLSIDREDFDLIPVLSSHGGWRRADIVFQHNLTVLVEQFNEELVAA